LGDPEPAQFLKGDTVKELVEHAGRLAQAMAAARAQDARSRLPRVEFDGGARDPAPVPTDAMQEHNQFLADLFRNGGRNGETFGESW
jgi:hypothetical protein